MTFDSRARILIADSDPVLRRGLYKRLLDSELFADSVSDGREALEKLSTASYAVVVVDLALQAVAAERILEVIGQMPQRQRPVVLVLAAPGAARSLDVEVVQIVLRRPCDLAQLSDMVQSCVRTMAARLPSGQPLDRSDEVGSFERLSHDGEDVLRDRL